MPKYTLIGDPKSQHNRTFPVKNVPILVLFGIGVVIGVSFALIYAQNQIILVDRSPQIHFDHLETFNAIIPINDTKNMHAMAKDIHALENDTIATNLYKEVRILCWILTTPANHRSRAIHVKQTWGKRCNKLLFMSTKYDASLDSISLNVSADNSNVLWGKTKRAFQYIYEHHRNDADWFLKADDDTYVILENLRYFLYAYSTNDPIYFGYKMNRANELKHGYFSGGAGYVLSKNALEKFANLMQTKNSSVACNLHTDYGAEDFEMGKCMEGLDVIAGDTRDELNRGRFFLNTPEAHLIPKKIDKSYWYWQYMWYRSDEGLDCCSDNTISFHYIRPEQFYVFEYMLYRLRAYGVVAYPQPLPKKVNFTEISMLLQNEKPEGAPIPSSIPN